MSGAPTATIGNDTFELPEGKLWCIFNADDSVAILQRDPENGSFDGYSVVDSVRLRGSQGADSKAIAKLFINHGARLVSPTSAPA